MSSINDKLTQLQTIKSDIKQKLVANGVEDVTDDFSTYANKIDEVVQIAGSGGNYGWPEYFDFITKNGTETKSLFRDMTIDDTTWTFIVDNKDKFSKTTTTYYMFYYSKFDNANKFTYTLPNLDLRECTTTLYMFGQISKSNYNNPLYLDLSGIQTTWKLKNMNDMFYYSNFHKINLTGISTYYVQSMDSLFSGCQYLEEVIGDIDCRRLTNGLYPSTYSNPFYNCKKLRKLSLINIYSGFEITNSAKYSINLSPTVLDHDSCLQIINELPTLPTGYTNIVLTLPTTNDVTDAEKQLATEKNWTVVN